MHKKILLILALILSCASAWASPGKVIFDTDMGNDVDDCIALEMLYRYVDQGDIMLLGVVSSKREPQSVQFIDLLGTFSCHPEIPVGIARTYPEENRHSWNGDFAYKILFGGNYAGMYRNASEVPDGFRLMRRLLSENGGVKDITMIAVGFSTNLFRLMQSGPDDISPLSGMDLIRANVEKLVMMAGNFHKEKPEYNVKSDVPAARAILSGWPTPILLSDYEVGWKMRMPLRLVHDYFGENHPVTVAFDMYLPTTSMPTERCLYDPSAVLFAVEPSDRYLSTSLPGRIEVRDDAVTVFTPDPTGNRYYAEQDESQKTASEQRIFELCRQPERILVEAESFSDKGGWSVDQQFMDLMGSPYLIAHGMGQPVADASTTVDIPSDGLYHIYVRTFNWVSPWTSGLGPGRFRISVGNKVLKPVLGSTGDGWMWQSAGSIKLKKGPTLLSLKDLTGFDGRCDAVFLTTAEGSVPPSGIKDLDAFRRVVGAITIGEESSFDFVVAGGGVAGMCAAVSAAREGLKVALINDRPVLGGNNSSEIRVHLGGRIEMGPYPALGRMLREFGHSKMGNAQPAENYEDEKKTAFIAGEKNVTLFSSTRVTDVVMAEPGLIKGLIVRNIETGEEHLIKAPVFCDCTGDGTVGFLSGADWRMGREGRDEFGESLAPEKADALTMGSSVQWYSKDTGRKSRFPEFNYGVTFTEENCEKVKMGEWTWETGMNRNQITDFERIRDYGLLVIYSNWSFLKNHSSDKRDYENLCLDWVAYIAGKRESRRLLGDYILSQEDVDKNVFHEDRTFTATWHFDLHFPDPGNSLYFPGEEFKAETKSNLIYPYAVPYRCLYSRNVNNLFMAGRDISVTHVALGSTRLMRTGAMMGEVVGMAAGICKKHNALPRDVYRLYLPELRSLMEKGSARTDIALPDNQNFNQGGYLKEPLVNGKR